MTHDELKRRILAGDRLPGVSDAAFNAVLRECLSEAGGGGRWAVVLQESRPAPSPHERLHAAFLGEAVDQRPVSDLKCDPAPPTAPTHPLSLEAHLAELKAKYGAQRAADVPRSSPYHPITHGYLTLQEQDEESGFTAAHPNGLTEREVDLARARLAAAFTGEQLLVTR